MTDNEKSALKKHCEQFLTNVKETYSKNRPFATSAECKNFFDEAFEATIDERNEYQCAFTSHQDRREVLVAFREIWNYLSDLYCEQSKRFQSLKCDALLKSLRPFDN